MYEKSVISFPTRRSEWRDVDSEKPSLAYLFSFRSQKTNGYARAKPPMREPKERAKRARSSARIKILVWMRLRAFLSPRALGKSQPFSHPEPLWRDKKTKKKFPPKRERWRWNRDRNFLEQRESNKKNVHWDDAKKRTLRKASLLPSAADDADIEDDILILVFKTKSSGKIEWGGTRRRFSSQSPCLVFFFFFSPLSRLRRFFPFFRERWRSFFLPSRGRRTFH